MLLTTVEAVRDRNGMDNTTLVNDAIESSLRTASSSLQTGVRTTFAEGTAVTDLFYVRDTRRVGKSMQTRLLMSKGFLKTSPAVTVKSAERSQWFTTGDGTVDDLRNLAGVDYTTINHNRGLVLITGKDLSDRFIQVTYDCGFAVSGTPAVYQAVPQWLIDAAILVTSIALEKNPALRDDEDTEFSVKELQTQKDAAIGNNVRYEPSALNPMV